MSNQRLAAEVTTDPFSVSYDVAAPDGYTLRGRSNSGDEGLFRPTRCRWEATKDGQLKAVASGPGAGPLQYRLFFRTWTTTPPRWFPPVPVQLIDYVEDAEDAEVAG